MDSCSKCGQPAKYFRLTGLALAFSCDLPLHLRSQGGDTDEWRGVGAGGGGLLATARLGAATVGPAVK